MGSLRNPLPTQYLYSDYMKDFPLLGFPKEQLNPEILGEAGVPFYSCEPKKGFTAFVFEPVRIVNSHAYVVRIVTTNNLPARTRFKQSGGSTLYTHADDVLHAMAIIIDYVNNLQEVPPRVQRQHSV